MSGSQRLTCVSPGLEKTVVRFASKVQGLAASVQKPTPRSREHPFPEAASAPEGRVDRQVHSGDIRNRCCAKYRTAAALSHTHEPRHRSFVISCGNGRMTSVSGTSRAVDSPLAGAMAAVRGFDRPSLPHPQEPKPGSRVRCNGACDGLACC